MKKSIMDELMGSYMKGKIIGIVLAIIILIVLLVVDRCSMDPRFKEELVLITYGTTTSSSETTTTTTEEETTTTTSETTTTTTTTTTETTTTTTTTTSETTTTITKTTTTTAKPKVSTGTLVSGIKYMTYYGGKRRPERGSSGRTLVNCYSVATNILPQGSIVKIVSSDGSINGTFRVDDCGCANNVIDIYFKDYSTVPKSFRNGGKVECKVYLIK
jgi:hypothetical protein